MGHSNNLKCYYQNTRGPRGKLGPFLKNKITLANYDCIALTETWLTSDFSSSQLFDDS